MAVIFWHAKCDPGRSGGCLRDGAGAATNSCAWVSRSRDLIGGGGAGEDGNGHSREEREERFTVRVWACAAWLRSTLRLTGGPMLSPLIELLHLQFFFPFYFARVVGRSVVWWVSSFLCNSRNRFCVQDGMCMWQDFRNNALIIVCVVFGVGIDNYGKHSFVPD